MFEIGLKKYECEGIQGVLSALPPTRPLDDENTLKSFGAAG